MSPTTHTYSRVFVQWSCYQSINQSSNTYSPQAKNNDPNQPLSSSSSNIQPSKKKSKKNKHKQEAKCTELNTAIGMTPEHAGW